MKAEITISNDGVTLILEIETESIYEDIAIDQWEKQNCCSGILVKRSQGE